jgi:hypothetical protein
MTTAVESAAPAAKKAGSEADYRPVSTPEDWVARIALNGQISCAGVRAVENGIVEP